ASPFPSGWCAALVAIGAWFAWPLAATPAIQTSQTGVSSRFMASASSRRLSPELCPMAYSACFSMSWPSPAGASRIAQLRVILAGAVLILGVSAWAENPSVPAGQLEAAQRAKASFQRGDYREAEQIFEHILSAAPDNLYVLSNLGVIRFRAGKLKP